MLLRFEVRNYRSFRDEVILDMETVGLADHKDCLLSFRNDDYLPVISINGKNGGGKSNIVRAMWLSTQFIKNAQRTQYESAEIPVCPFELNDYSKDEPTSFEYEYEDDGVWYCYGFSATKKEICEEHLYWSPKGQKTLVFKRDYQEFTFPVNKEKKIKEMISKTVGPNQLFFALSCTMNYEPCIKAMKWFRTKLFFSKDYKDLGANLMDYSEDKEMLKSITNIAKIADLGISDMKFEFDNKQIDTIDNLPDDVVRTFKENLNGKVQYNELKASSYHYGVDLNGLKKEYELTLDDESDGTLKLMSRAIAMESALKNGGVFIIDEIEDKLHPKLVEYIINCFQQNNTSKAQLIFTTHSIDIMNRELLRRDQYYLVDRDSSTGVSELYSVADFSVRNDEKIGKAYLLGKYGAIPYIKEV